MPSGDPGSSAVPYAPLLQYLPLGILDSCSPFTFLSPLTLAIHRTSDALQATPYPPPDPTGSTSLYRFEPREH